jgi:peptidoglycan/LPS O-acetylase OafA/YrhL
MLTREHLTTGGISLTAFYIRRFKRLTPALIVMVLAAVLVSPLWMQETTALTDLGATYFIANLVIQLTLRTSRSGYLVDFVGCV